MENSHHVLNFKSKFSKQENIKQFFDFLLYAKKYNLISDEDFQNLKLQLKDKEINDYLISQVVLTIFGTLIWTMNSSIALYFATVLGDEGGAIYMYFLLQVVRSGVFRVGLEYFGKNISDKNSVSITSFLPIIGGIAPLVHLARKKGIQLPSYFWAYLSSPRLVNQIKTDANDRIINILDKKNSRTKYIINTANKIITYLNLGS